MIEADLKGYAKNVHSRSFCGAQKIIAYNYIYSVTNDSTLSVQSHQTMVFIPKAKSDLGPVRRNPIWKTPAPPIPSRKIHMAAIPPYQQPPPVDLGPKKKGKFQGLRKFFTAPIDGIAALVRKCYPSDDCMRCVKCTYWIVLIIGGIVTAIVALKPFC